MTQTDFVYIVEDDSVSGFLIKHELDNHSTFKENTTFENGKIAFDELTMNSDSERLLPDLILLDINMPIMNGWEFLDAFSGLKYSKKIPIVILTSSINPADVEKSKTYNVVKGFISKPLNSEKLDHISELI